MKWYQGQIKGTEHQVWLHDFGVIGECIDAEEAESIVENHNAEVDELLEALKKADAILESVYAQYPVPEIKEAIAKAEGRP
jgi:predicted  nucleic acid-binding Zn ribbon protein